MRFDAFENFYFFFFLVFMMFDKNKEVEVFFKLFFQHPEEFLKINFSFWSFVRQKCENFSFRD